MPMKANPLRPSFLEHHAFAMAALDPDPDTVCERLSDTRFRVMNVGDVLGQGGKAAAAISLDGVAGRIERVDEDDIVVELEAELQRWDDAALKESEVPGGISFETALAIAAADRNAVLLSETRDCGSYWHFKFLGIGAGGSVVDKRTGSRVATGTAFPRETWLWAYERGLLADDGFSLRVLRVHDVEATIRVLRKVLTSATLRQLPTTLMNAPVVLADIISWIAIGALHEDNGVAFEWEAVKPAS